MSSAREKMGKRRRLRAEWEEKGETVPFERMAEYFKRFGSKKKQKVTPVRPGGLSSSHGPLAALRQACVEDTGYCVR